jgi:hypothetical protein
VRIPQSEQTDRINSSDNKRRKVDLREEYFVRGKPSIWKVGCPLMCFVPLDQRLQSAQADDWDVVRVPRPKGVPEWGMPVAEAPAAEPGPERKRLV